MAEFRVNPERHDPYKGFRFLVRWDGRPVPGVCRVSPLRRTTAAVDERSGGDASRDRNSPGMTNWDPVVLQRGRTHDPAFEDWANLVWSSTEAMSLPHYRKDVRIELQNEQGNTVMAFVVHRAWPSAYTALDQLDAESDATLLETLTLEHEGWERDTEVSEPVEQ